jgi:uncharacterized protein (DUF1684 family)
VRRGAAHLLFLAVLLIAAACSPPPQEDYATRIQNERSRKDQMFRAGGNDSPIRPGELEKFVPLSYFPIDENYAVPAQLEPIRQPVTVQIPTSTGTIRDMQIIGTLKFTLKGQPAQLTAFSEQGSRLFVPFADLTSGTETYPAGRYMNLDPSPSGIYIVDFNVAYHPYCYYNPEYDCPYPPSQNRLKVPVRAGEKLRKDDATVGR